MHKKRIERSFGIILLFKYIRGIFLAYMFIIIEKTVVCLIKSLVWSKICLDSGGKNHGL